VGKKKLIVVWPYRFRDFDWQRFELDHLAPHVEIHVHELIEALTPEFVVAYANQSENPAVQRFSSLKDWRREFKRVSKNSVVFSHVRPINLKSTLICWTLRRSKSKIVGFSTGGVPFSDFRVDVEKVDLPRSVKNMLHFFRRNALAIFMPDCVVVGGTEEVARVRRDNPNKTSVVLASSSDYSNSQKWRSLNNLNSKAGVYLDTGFPGFPRDEIVEGIREQVAPEAWYPQLDRFIGFVEGCLRSSVVIAIHPKHIGRDHKPMFQHRETVGGKTAELVASSSYVIATNSTSISFAVAFDKPLLLVTSDQIQNGRDQYKASLITNISRETGARVFNIDREYSEEELRAAMVIDRAKRESYKRKYLTSRTDDKPNYQVLLDEVIDATE